MDTLLPFASTYLCESAFLSLTNLKTKHRSSLGDIETVLRPVLTKIEPRFDLLCKKMQAHLPLIKYKCYYLMPLIVSIFYKILYEH